MHYFARSGRVATLTITVALVLSACQFRPPPLKAPSVVATPIVPASEAGGKVSADWKPPPQSSNVTVFHEGLEYPRGLKFDTSRNLYVAEAGKSGDKEVKAATCLGFTSAFMPCFMGNTSRVSRISPDGNLCVGNINALPTVAGAAKVFKVSMAGKVEIFAGGLTNILGLTFDIAGQQLYVLQMSNDETEIPALGTGRVVRINPSGLRDVMTSGLSYPAGMALGRGGAFGQGANRAD